MMRRNEGWQSGDLERGQTSLETTRILPGLDQLSTRTPLIRWWQEFVGPLHASPEPTAEI